MFHLILLKWQPFIFVFALILLLGWETVTPFFSIRKRVAKVLPEPFTTPMMRALPVLLVFVAMFYWLWRVRTGRHNKPGELSRALAPHVNI